MNGALWIGATVILNVTGTFLARIASQQEKNMVLLAALVAYTVAFLTWSKVLKHFNLGFASSVTTGLILTASNVIAFCWLKESYSAAKLFFTSLIVVGVIGVNLSQ